MNRLLIFCVFLRLALPAAAAERDPRVGDVDPVMPAEKLERALNGTFHFPSSPEVAWTADERGFAKERLYHVPAAGVHPRILFAPEDLPPHWRRWNYMGPTTSWNEDRTRLTIAWKDQTDIYAVSVTADGRRIFNRLEHPTP